MIIDWEVEYSLNSLGCTIENVKNARTCNKWNNTAAGAVVAPPETVTTSQIHKFTKGRNV